MASFVSSSTLASLLPQKLLSDKTSKVEYKAWQQKIDNYLCCCELEEAVETEVKEDSSIESGAYENTKKSSKSNAHQLTLKQKSAIAYGIIVSRLEDQLLIQLSTVEKNNSYKLMQAIKSRFGTVNFFSRLQARRDFNRIHLKANESMASYGARIRCAARELESMDSKSLVEISELELISRLVDGLPKEFDNLILGLVRGIETITFDEFVAILESRYSMSKGKSSHGAGDSSGDSVDNPIRIAAAAMGSNRNHQRFNGTCYRCKQSGHRAAECEAQGETRDTVDITSI
jgi:hypothetical protein